MSSPAPNPIPLSMNNGYSKHDDTSRPKQDMMESSRICFSLHLLTEGTAFPYPHGRPVTLFVARCIDHPIPLSFIKVLFVAANGTMGVRGVVGPSLWNQISSIEWLQKSHKNLNLLLSLYLCLLSVEDKCGTSKCSNNTIAIIRQSHQHHRHKLSHVLLHFPSPGHLWSPATWCLCPCTDDQTRHQSPWDLPSTPEGMFFRVDHSDTKRDCQKHYELNMLAKGVLISFGCCLLYTWYWKWKTKQVSFVFTRKTHL